MIHNFRNKNYNNNNNSSWPTPSTILKLQLQRLRTRASSHIFDKKNIPVLFGTTLLSHKLQNSRSYSLFNEVIPTEYLKSKLKAQQLVFNYFELYDTDKIKEYLDTLDKGLYTVFIKVRYVDDRYHMVGNQFGFTYNKNDIDINDLHSIVNQKLDTLFTKYKIKPEHEVRSVYIYFKSVDLRFLEELGLSNAIIKDMPDKVYHDIKYSTKLPISVDENSLGIPLTLHYATGSNIVEYIELKTLSGTINFLVLIKKSARFLRPNHPDNITIFDDTFKFYFLRDTRSSYVLAISNVNNSVVTKIRYSINGVVINQTQDTLIENNMILRKFGDYENLIQDNTIIHSKINYNLKCIPKIKNEVYFISKRNIGSIDTETYLASDGINKIYSLGFMTNLSKEPTIYYINQETRDSNKLVLELIDELLRPKYSDINFYCHNLGGYDIVFILKVLYEYNENNSEKYRISCIFRDNRIMKVNISQNENKLTILDSYLMLNNNLRSLAKNFEVDTLKSFFPYSFARDNTLFYIGQIPFITYYEDIEEDIYWEMHIKYKEDWSFKDESIKYLKDDLLSLYQVLSKVNKQVFEDYNVHITDKITISGLAVKIFLKSFYNNNIPSINKLSMYRDLKQAYYGGITEVYIPYGEDSNYYDVNSLYPYVAFQDLPGLICSREYFSNKLKPRLDDLFGFYHCEIITPEDSYLGLLPVRNESGIYFPLGKWTGWYFSEELKFAVENGYKVNVLSGYRFNRERNVFTNYINEIYKIKSNPKNETQKSMAKSLLNNLLGRFGIQLERDITKIVNDKTFRKLSLMYKISGYKIITDDKIIVSYKPSLDYDIIKSHNLDFVELSKSYKDPEHQNLNATSVVISAAVTAYARIHITKLKLYIINKGGKIYYSDTDSIVTDITLPTEMLSSHEIGKLKLEHKVKKGIYITGKTYCLVTQDNKFINKAKGIVTKAMTLTNYEWLLEDINIKTKKKVSKKNWAEGEVTISEKIVTLDSDSYKKRTKIFKNNNWVATKPIIINHLDKELIIYNNNLSLIKVELQTPLLPEGVNYKLRQNISSGIVCSVPEHKVEFINTIGVLFTSKRLLEIEHDLVVNTEGDSIKVLPTSIEKLPTSTTENKAIIIHNSLNKIVVNSVPIKAYTSFLIWCTIAAYYITLFAVIYILSINSITIQDVYIEDVNIVKDIKNDKIIETINENIINTNIFEKWFGKPVHYDVFINENTTKHKSILDNCNLNSIYWHSDILKEVNNNSVTNSHTIITNSLLNNPWKIVTNPLHIFDIYSSQQKMFELSDVLNKLGNDISSVSQSSLDIQNRFNKLNKESLELLKETQEVKKSLAESLYSSLENQIDRLKGDNQHLRELLRNKNNVMSLQNDLINLQNDTINNTSEAGSDSD